MEPKIKSDFQSKYAIFVAIFVLMVRKTEYLFLVFVLFITVSCSEYNKLVKSTDLDKKYEMAIKYYEKDDYVKALPLLEELVSVYRGTAKAESIYYYYAYTNYNMGDYTIAGYHFHNFVKTFPNSIHTEECAYMNAYCYYLNSPSYSLDQTDTKAAIKEFQAFINQYPKSTRLAECNEIVDKLRAKLERKSYEIAKQYYYIGDYKAAIYSFNNTLKDFPDTKYREELSFLIIQSNYLLAANSIESKKEERLTVTIDSYIKFIDTFPKSTYLKDAESIYESALKMKEKLKS